MPENRYSGDVFGKNVSDSTRNDGDLAGHYPYSQERWRFFEDTIEESNRIFLEYNEDARYQHKAFGTGVSNGGYWDVHKIAPNANDVLFFKTAERFRYVVGYESRATWAFSISQDLQEGDEIIIGPVSNFNGTDFHDGYAFKLNSTLGPNKCEFVLYREGVEQNSKTLNLSTPITEFQRCEWRYAWYNIMGAIGTQSYEFKNVQLGSIKSEANQRGPAIGSFNIACKITAGPNTDNLEVYLGSAAWQTWGDVDTLIRTKVVPNFNLSVAANTDYQPLVAYRKDPKRSYIKAELDEMIIKRFTGNADLFALAIIVSEQNLRDAGGNLLQDSDYSVPPELSQTNSVLQRTLNVDQFPDSTGTLVTSTPNPGGYQIGWSSLYTTTGAGGAKSESVERFAKRAINNGDNVLILARPRTSTSGTATIELTTEQDW